MSYYKICLITKYNICRITKYYILFFKAFIKLTKDFITLGLIKINICIQVKTQIVHQETISQHIVVAHYTKELLPPFIMIILHTGQHFIFVDKEQLRCRHFYDYQMKNNFVFLIIQYQVYIQFAIFLLPVAKLHILRCYKHSLLSFYIHEIQ